MTSRTVYFSICLSTEYDDEECTRDEAIEARLRDFDNCNEINSIGAEDVVIDDEE